MPWTSLVLALPLNCCAAAPDAGADANAYSDAGGADCCGYRRCDVLYLGRQHVRQLWRRVGRLPGRNIGHNRFYVTPPERATICEAEGRAARRRFAVCNRLLHNVHGKHASHAWTIVVEMTPVAVLAVYVGARVDQILGDCSCQGGIQPGTRCHSLGGGRSSRARRRGGCWLCCGGWIGRQRR